MYALSSPNNDSISGALTNHQIYSLTYIYLSVLPLSLLGSGSVLGVSLVKGKCFKSQVRPLFHLCLSDFLAASFLISTAAIQTLPTALYIEAYHFCAYGVMLALMFYAVSFLMTIVYAFEVHQAVNSWRNTRASPAQEGNHSEELSKLYLRYGLAWLIPLLLFLGQVISRTSMMDIVPIHIDKLQHAKSNQSEESYGLFCSSCIILIHKSKDVCYQYPEDPHVDLGKKITFFVYLLLVMTCCTSLYCSMNLGRLTNGGTPNEETRLLGVDGDGFSCTSVRRAYRTARFFQLTFFLCWAPAFILSVFSFTNMKPSSLYFLFILQALTVSLQGLLNSLAYGWSRPNFRQEATWERRLLDGLQIPFFENSLVLAQQ